ncbi:MAG: FAD-dependent thymidylate synthase [Anaerolineae bacterium]
MTVELINKRVNVLDRGFVELQDVMPHPMTGITPDNAIVAAARTSFLGESKGAEQDRKLLHYLVRNKHTSPLEQVELKFRLKMPLIAWWQQVRHRTASLNLQSGRYVPFEEDEFYVPSVWRKQSPSNKQASLGELESDEGARLTQDLIAHYQRGYELYRKALDMGVAREQARLFLAGFSVYYTGIVKWDLHNLFHYLHLRMDSDAQYEIRVYAETIYREFVKLLCPIASEAFEQYILNVPTTTST